MSNHTEKERTIQNMKDAGCNEDTINRFLICYQDGDVKGELKVLANHRQTLLDVVHKREKEIDCLDYLVYQIEKSVRESAK